MMKKWTMALAAALAGVLVAGSQAARAGGGADIHALGRRLLHGEALEAQGVAAHLDGMAAMLELSASQRKAVAAVLKTALPELETRALALVQAHAEQLERLHAAELDEEALRAASLRAGAAQGELAVAVARLLRDVHSVLTPEQLERVAHLHEGDPMESLAELVRGVGQDARAWADRQ